MLPGQRRGLRRVAQRKQLLMNGIKLILLDASFDESKKADSHACDGVPLQTNGVMLANL